MALDFITEEQARILAPVGSTIVRQYRGPLTYILLAAFTICALVAVTLPLWRTQLASPPSMPNHIAIGLGLFLLFANGVALLDLRAAIKPTSWLMIIAPDKISINFRHFTKFKRPASDKTVVVIDKRDLASVELFSGLTMRRRGTRTQFETVTFIDLVLQEPLTADANLRIITEQTGSVAGWGAALAASSALTNSANPVVTVTNTQFVIPVAGQPRLRIVLYRTAPRLKDILAALQMMAPVQPVASPKTAVPLRGTGS